MQAMVLEAPGAELVLRERPEPEPGAGMVRIRVGACGVCRTDLHVVDGELPDIRYPIVPGHEIVGCVEALGPRVTTLRLGERVGVPWLGHTCGVCRYCKEGMENLCDRPLFTGYTRDGGYATLTIADARYAFPLGEKPRGSARGVRKIARCICRLGNRRHATSATWLPPSMTRTNSAAIARLHCCGNEWSVAVSADGILIRSRLAKRPRRRA
jgi:D-arabinose 1-dehydrogenase-like Zn-dependent alcohol dehydrogenase